MNSPRYEPTPEEIALSCKEFQANWTDDERENRIDLRSVNESQMKSSFEQVRMKIPFVERMILDRSLQVIDSILDSFKLHQIDEDPSFHVMIRQAISVRVMLMHITAADWISEKSWPEIMISSEFERLNQFLGQFTNIIDGFDLEFQENGQSTH